MFDRFSDDARKSLSAARQAAQRFQHDYIGTEHMLLGVIEPADGIAVRALTRLGIDVRGVRAQVDDIVKPGTREPVFGQLPFTPRGKKVLEVSLAEAQAARHEHIGTGHLLLGLLVENEGIAAQVLTRLGLTAHKVRSVVLELVGEGKSAHDGPPAQGAGLSGAPRPNVGRTFQELMARTLSEKPGGDRSPVEAEHVLLAMLDGDDVAARILRELGATPDGVRRRIEELRRS